MRDYADWLGPYIRSPVQFEESDWYAFWILDIDAARMPADRLTSLATLYQLQRPITAGNTADALHSVHLLDVDVLMTADRDFHWVLEQLVQRHFPNSARPRLIDRAATDAACEVGAAMQF
jgi:hypothetical protein